MACGCLAGDVFCRCHLCIWFEAHGVLCRGLFWGGLFCKGDDVAVYGAVAPVHEVAGAVGAGLCGRDGDAGFLESV